MMRASKHSRWTNVLGLACGFWLAPGLEKARAAGGSYMVDDFDVNDAGICTLEASYGAARNGDIIAASTPGCGFKLGKLPMEIDGEFQRTRASDVWTANAGTTVKAVLLPMTNHVGIGLSTTALWDTTTGASASTNINLPVTLELTNQLRLHVNGGWLYDRGFGQSFATWGISPEYTLNRYVQLTVELFQQSGKTVDPRTVNTPRLQTGVRLSPTDKLDIDVIYGRNINGENAHWVTVGFTVEF